MSIMGDIFEDDYNIIREKPNDASKPNQHKEESNTYESKFKNSKIGIDKDMLRKMNSSNISF